MSSPLFSFFFFFFNDTATTEIYTLSLHDALPICGDLSSAERREWLCTNGIGGFASGTVAGTLTRRYHGLLVAALKPPLGRTLLCTRAEETVTYDGLVLPLFANRWAGNVIDPHGYRTIERFSLEGTTPMWTYAVA